MRFTRLSLTALLVCATVASSPVLARDPINVRGGHSDASARARRTARWSGRSRPIGELRRSELGENTTTVLIADTELNLLGKTQHWIDVSITDGPYAKTITGQQVFSVSQGAQFQVLYQNTLANTNGTTMHQHGLVPPYNLDGVPYVSSPPIESGHEVYKEFDLNAPQDQGTYWVHSHLGFQLDDGQALPIILEKEPPVTYPMAEELRGATEAMFFIQEFCPYATDTDTAATANCDSRQVYETLHAAFNSTMVLDPSCPYDVEQAHDTDVAYVAVLANGALASDPPMQQVDADSYVRLRVVNAGGMSDFLVVLGLAKSTTSTSSAGETPVKASLVAVDGQFIEPYSNSSFWMSPAQRLDILVQVPGDSVVIVRAITGGLYAEEMNQAAIVLYATEEPPIVSLPLTVPNVGLMGFGQERLLRAFEPFPYNFPDVTFQVNLTGDNGFDSINDVSYQLFPLAPPVPNPNPLNVRSGQRVEILIENHNSDPHSMHLHGVSFMVTELNGKALPYNGAIRDTLLMPGGCSSARVVFDADSPGIWPFHCHLSFHLAAGMLTTVEYTY